MSVTLSVVPNEAVVIYAPDPSGASSVPTQYWIRCLPPDFPFIQVNKTGPRRPAGSPATTSPARSLAPALYAMVLDGNGTPVWYQKLYLTGADNVQPLPGDIISWGQLGETSTRGSISPRRPPSHRSHDRLARVPVAAERQSHDDLCPGRVQGPVRAWERLGRGYDYGTPASAADNTVVDCIVQELDPSNNVVWSWDAADHLGVDETNTASGLPNSGPPWLLDTVNGSPEADIYHCNSVAVDEDAASPYYGDVMVSMRHLNAVYLIDPTTGDVVWKMGGTAFTPDDPEEQQSTRRSISPSPATRIRASAASTMRGSFRLRIPRSRTSACSTITLTARVQRGVEFAIDATTGSATPDCQYRQPQGLTVMATGSFRRMPDSSDAICSGSGVVGWGLSDGSGGFPSGITEADGSGNVLFDISFPDGEAIYRGIKVDASDVDLALLRQTAGWTGMTIPPPPSPPTVTGVSPASGPVGAGTTVTISGSGFSGASSVTFGGRAAVFSVDGSGSIVATSPAGIAPGQVDVVVTAPGGSSAVSPVTSSLSPSPRRLRRCASSAWYPRPTAGGIGWRLRTGRCMASMPGTSDRPPSSGSINPSWAWPPLRMARGTGSLPPMEGCSHMATPGFTGPVGASR